VSRFSRDGLRPIAGRARALVASELDPEGVILRNSIRAGAALAAGQGIANDLDGNGIAELDMARAE
jgi:hypothetical protein